MTIIDNDLDKNREFISDNVKEIFEHCESIEYDTCDMYMQSPESFPGKRHWDEILENDIKCEKLYGVKMRFRKHYYMTFQELIDLPEVEKYNVIWFFGCCNPHYLVDTCEEYVNNLTNVAKDSVLIHTDGDKHYGEFNSFLRNMNFSDKIDTIDDDAKEKIDFLLCHLRNTQTGVYVLK